MNRPFQLLLALCIVLLGSLPASADDQAAIKARMAKRLPTIVALAQRGVIGENNLGKLTPRGTLTEAEKSTVNAENADRDAVYAMIAKRTGSSAKVVGQQRARQIRSSAPEGTWIQMPDGSWVKK